MSPAFILVVHVPEPGVAGALERGLAAHGHRVVVQPDPDVWTNAGADAVFVPTPWAERWGALPLVHQTQIFRMTEAERPQMDVAFVLAGGLCHLDEMDDRYQAIIDTLSECVVAIREHQLEDEITSVAVLGRHLSVGELDDASICAAAVEALGR